MSQVPQRFYEFDSFLLDSQQRLLLADGQPVDLTPKVFDILFELVQNSGRLVEKKELMDRVWPDSFVEEANLTQHISTLRKRLALYSGKERYILTVPGRGYRFVVGVKEWDDDAVTTVLERIRSRVIGEDRPFNDIGAAVLPPERAGEVIFEDTRIRTSTSEPRPAVIPAPAGASKPGGLIFVVGAVLLVCGFGVAFFKGIGRAKPVAFSKTTLVKFTTSGKTTCAAVSPDGRYVAFAVLDGGRGSLLLRQIDTSGPGVEVLAPVEAQYFLKLTFSPDGKYLYYVASHNAPSALLRVPILGGTPTKLAEDVDSAVSFSPDGKQIVYVRGYPDLQETSLLLANADGSAERKLASLKTRQQYFTLLGGPAWSPDGSSILTGITTVADAGEYQELCEVRIADGKLKPLTGKHWQSVGRSAWLVGGRGAVMLAADQETGLSQIWHVSYPEGAVRKISNDLNDYSDLSLTADGAVLSVLQSERMTNVWLVPDYDTGRAVQISSGNYDGVEGLAWLPDGRIAYTAWTNGLLKIWLGDRSKSAQRQLIENTGSEGSLTISPDGRRVVFSAKQAGQEHLWLADTDGSHLRRLTDGFRESHPAFAPDGKSLVYKAYTGGNPYLFKVSAEGGAVQRLTERISGPPAISPDGKTVACAYREVALSPQKLALIPLTGDPQVKLLDFKDQPRAQIFHWTADGKAVAYVANQGGISNIWSKPVDGGPAIQLTNFRAERIFNFAISPDGHQLAVARGHQSNDVVLIKAIP